MFPISGRQLYVGEGDFSLTKSLSKHFKLPKGTIVSCFSEELTEEANRNKESLQAQGITVLTGVDATKLQEHALISKQRYDYIIFNFPHTGKKMKIQLCRNLLREFLCASEPLLAEDGQVWVTLCAGQGGTAGDTAARAWSDSWQLTAQAAAGRLQLLKLLPFIPEHYPGYRPTGNRGSQHRRFHASRGVIHVLTQGRPLQLEDLHSRVASAQHPLVDDEPAVLTSYWYNRLRHPGDTVAEGLVRRLAPAPVTRHALVHHGGVTKLAAGKLCHHPVASPASAKSAERGKSAAEEEECVEGSDELQSLASGGVPDGCHLWCTADLDCQTAVNTASAPLTTVLTVTGDATDPAADARGCLAALGIACKATLEGDHRRLLASCGGDVQLCVASVTVESDPDNRVLLRDIVNVECVGTAALSDSCPAGDRSCDLAALRTRWVAVYYVDRVATCLALSGDDWRPAARSDFASLAPLVFRSLHPPAYTFDMSFWVDRDGRAADAGEAVRPPAFSMQRLRWCLRSLLGDVVTCVSSLDEYTEPGSGRRARTVRIQYQDVSCPLSRELCRRLHVEWLPPLLSQLLGVDAR